MASDQKSLGTQGVEPEKGSTLDPRLIWVLYVLLTPFAGYLLSLANLSTEHIAAILIIG